VKPGDILVGKITPKAETELSPEERLLRAIFGEKAADVKDSSLVVSPGVEGVVIDVKVFSRRDRLSKTDEEVVEEKGRLEEMQKEYKEKEAEIFIEMHEMLGGLLLDQPAPDSIMHLKTGEALIHQGKEVTQDMLELIENESIENLIIPSNDTYEVVRNLLVTYSKNVEKLQVSYKTAVDALKKGDIDLETGVIKEVNVYIAKKRKLQVGDKMAGRHGNKGVVSTIVPECDMPYTEDGTPINMILNPLGVPSRMNLGQVLETHLGLAAKKSGIYVKTPIFEGFPEEKIWEMMEEQRYNRDGKLYLYD